MKKNILTIKDYNLGLLVMAIIVLFFGSMITYYFSFDFSFYIGPTFLLVGLMMIMMCQFTETIIDKNIDSISYRRKTINKTLRENTFSTHEVKRVLFYEQKLKKSAASYFFDNYGPGSNKGEKMIISEIKIQLNDNSSYLLKKKESNFYIWSERMKIEAKKIADFLEIDVDYFC